jgi:hypothetical protein
VSVRPWRNVDPSLNGFPFFFFALMVGIYFFKFNGTFHDVRIDSEAACFLEIVWDDLFSNIL